LYKKKIILPISNVLKSNWYQNTPLLYGRNDKITTSPKGLTLRS